MIRELIVRDILLIEHIALEFEPGLNVLTGETGAGKSILLDCLGFVLGWRGPTDLVRAGAEEGEVTAIFDPGDDPAIAAILDAAGIPPDDELIVRRVVSAGRKKAFVNDRRVSGEVLRDLGDRLLELHGQHDDKGLLDTREHRNFLDAFAGVGAELAATSEAWAAVRAAEGDLEGARQALADAERDHDFLQHSVEELEALAPESGEDASLDDERHLLKAAARIRGDIEAAADEIAEGGAQAATADALRRLEKVAPQIGEQLTPAIEALSRAFNELAHAEAALGETLRALDADPARLEIVEDRLFSIRALARKHNVQSDALPELLESFRTRCAAISRGDAHIAELEAALVTARETYQDAAADLSAKRRRGAKKLDAAVSEELKPLKMGAADFRTSITEGAPGPTGFDHIAFQVATNRGTSAGPLAKIASGGELSRFLLALKVCLKGDGARTMIFDEIDRGVGGATADAVGRRLQALAAENQLIIVTHSPQVAALAAHHFRVSKSASGAVTRTQVVALSEAERVDELARMLAGETISDEAKSAAKVLLAG